MALWDSVKNFLALQPALHERAIDSFVDHPGLTEQLMAVQGLTPRPWRVASLKEALGVPAVFRSVALIANTAGSLTLNAFRQGAILPDDQRPRLVVRPNPFSTPREFFRDTAYAMATRGEAWWWVAKRDPIDDSALSLMTVDPDEVDVTEDPADLRYPRIEWRGKLMRNEDMRHLTLLREPGGYRGIGPLKTCAAAVSVAVEAQEWAANFYASGGYPSIGIKSAMALTEAEAATLKAQWTDTPSNMPKVWDQAIEEVKEFAPNTQAGGMLDGREHQNGEIATAFGIPGSLIGHVKPGSTVTYQNLATEFDRFLRGCLYPDYLEPMEQAMSDLLTRSTVARFNTDALLRADVKTRYEVYSIGIAQGIFTPEFAAAKEGYLPGDVENAPVPFAVPAAIPTRLPIERNTPTELRCDGLRTLRGRITACGRLLSTTGRFEGQCPRCKKVYEAA